MADGTRFAHPVVQAAADALEQANGDRNVAKAALLRKLQDDRFRAAVTDFILDTAASQAMLVVTSADRRNLWSPIHKPMDRLTDSERVTLLAKGNAAGLLNFPLPGGKELHEATKDELLKAADFYLRHARTYAHRGRWLTKVAERVPENQTAGMVWSDDDLRKLQMETENE